MSSPEFVATSEQMMALLPSLYRIADATPTPESGYLHTLAGIVGEQLHELQDDLRALYDDLFIETCAPWVVPYIGELVGVLPVREIGDGSLTTRAQVANVIALRRRKGTADVVEELAESITGWASRVVEMFSHIATTQHLNHQRPLTTTVSLRSARDLEFVGTAFDPFVHTADVGWIRSGQGRFRPQNLAIFLWPEISLRFQHVNAVEVSGQRHRFHPLGLDTVLVTRRRSDTSIVAAATIEEVPWPISRRILDHNIELSAGDAGLYGPNASLFVTTSGGVVPRSDIVTCTFDDTEDGTGDWQNAADIKADKVGIDPQLGRIVLGANRSGPVRVDFGQSFTAEIGGGYPRVVPFDLADATHETVEAGSTGPLHVTIAAALTAVAGAGNILVNDSTTYNGPLATQVVTNAQITIAANATERPTIIVGGPIVFDCGPGSSVTLDGLLVSGQLIVTGTPRSVTVRNCTFVPGLSLRPDKTQQRPNEPSIILAVDPSVSTPELVIDRSITGAIVAPVASVVHISDSIIEGGSIAANEPAERLVAVSVPLAPFPSLGVGPHELQILVSGHEPTILDLGNPSTADHAVTAFNASTPPPQLRAALADDRLIVMADDDLSIRPAAPNDDTAVMLGLTTASSRVAVIGSAVANPPVFGQSTVVLRMRVGATASIELTLGTVPTTVAEAADELQTAIRAAGNGALFANTLVFAAGDRLIVVPGESDVHLAFASAPTDPTGAHVLGLHSGLWAIASDGAGATGPIVYLERVTVLGRTRASEVTLVSDAILAQPLIADRGQTGCVRFSYVAEGSFTPRRYKCVPNHDCDPQLAIASDRYGDFRYGELVPTESMIPVRYGSSAGAEMGAFASFQYREREQSLTFNLDEFMRFSMEAGLLDGRIPPGG